MLWKFEGTKSPTTAVTPGEIKLTRKIREVQNAKKPAPARKPQGNGNGPCPILFTLGGQKPNCAGTILDGLAGGSEIARQRGASASVTGSNVELPSQRNARGPAKSLAAIRRASR